MKLAPRAALTRRPSASSDSRYHVPNLERGLMILELLLEHPQGLQQTEIASRLGCSKTSVYRISMTLMEYGYLVRDEETKTLRLSRKLVALGSRSLGEEDLTAVSVDVMRRLRDEVGETVLIGTVVETELVVLGQVLGSHHFKFSVDLGTRLPLHSAAPGKAILAWLPEDERRRLIALLPFTRFNERTICDPAEYSRELDRVVAAGYAVDCGEQLSGIHCVSAPVYDRHGSPIAAIWTTGPSERIRRSDFPEVGARVMQHARQISERLGYGVMGLIRNGSNSEEDASK